MKVSGHVELFHNPVSRIATPDPTGQNRELAEETGLTATLGSVLGVFSRWFTKEESTAGEAGHMGAIVFDAIDVQGELRATFGAGTTDGVRWFDLEEIVNLPHVELVDFVVDLVA